MLLLGSSPVVREIVHELIERPELGMRAIGYVDDAQDPEMDALQLPYVGSIADLPRVAEELQPERIGQCAFLGQRIRLTAGARFGVQTGIRAAQILGFHHGGPKGDIYRVGPGRLHWLQAANEG